MPEDVQPTATEGQGAEGSDSGFYDLDSVAPEIRDQVVPHLKAMEGNVTKKFQEAAAYKKQWEPYEEIGINELEPEQIKGLLEFAKMANDPDQFGQWWQDAGKEMGLFEKFQDAAKSDDLDLDLEDDLSQEKINELIAKQVAEKVTPLEQSLREQEQERKAAQATEEVAGAMTSIRSENPDLFKGDEESQDKIEKMVARLAFSYSEDNSLSPSEMIQKGFADYKGLIGQGESGLFEQKDQQPPPPEGAGAADTSPEKISSFSDPRLKAAAEERLRKSLST